MEPGAKRLSGQHLVNAFWLVIVVGPVLSGVLVLAALGGLALAAAGSTDEAILKAAYLYNFAKFIEWPDEQRPILHFCVIGDSPVGEAIDRLIDKPVRQMKVGVRHGLPLQDIPQCDLVLLTADRLDSLDRVRQIVGSYPVVIVTESRGALPHGAMVAIIEIGDRLVFEVDQSAMRQAGLVVSGKMLQLARRVY